MKFRKIQLNEMAYSRYDASEICKPLGIKFIEHFDKIYNDTNNDSVKHWCNEMTAWWNKVRDIKVKPSSKIIYSGDLIDWFFNACDVASEYMTSENKFDEIELYNKFFIALLYDREKSTESLVKEMFPRDDNEIQKS